MQVHSLTYTVTLTLILPLHFLTLTLPRSPGTRRQARGGAPEAAGS